jgi:hypothetical protein
MIVYVLSRWIPSQASHGFLAWAEDLRDDKVFAAGTNAKKVASRALGSIFSGGWASKMEVPDQCVSSWLPLAWWQPICLRGRPRSLIR